MNGQPTPIGDVGSVAFDVADRLAIVNLFGAYAYTYDETGWTSFVGCSPSHQSSCCCTRAARSQGTSTRS